MGRVLVFFDICFFIFLLVKWMWDLLEYAIQIAEKSGADFVEARGESQKTTIIRFIDNIVKSVESSHLVGIGITVVIGKSRGHGFTGLLDKQSIESAVKKAIDAARGFEPLAELSAEPIEYKPRDYEGMKPSRIKDPEKMEFEEKIELAKRGINAVRGHEGIQSITTIYAELTGERFFLNSEGLKRHWRPMRNGLYYQVIFRKNGNIGIGREQFASSHGFEIYEKFKPEDLSEKALKSAEESAEARGIKPGKYPIVADPDFAGVLAHESFGHLTEGDYVATKASILYGKLGEKVGSDYATIIESGDPVNYGWYIPYDDEGVATLTVKLLDKGVLRAYLHSRSTAKIMNSESTGNARAISFMFPAIVRMRNTYFGPGDMSKEEVFEIIKKGVYAEGSVGGQTEDTGNFTFAADRAYWIENGEISYPLKGVVIRAHILEFLKNIIGASKDLVVKTSVLGGCGKGGQSPLPVGDGGPYLAIREAIVGGGV